MQRKRRPRSPRSTQTRAKAKAAGFRSGLEHKIAEKLTKQGVAYEYEARRIPYTGKPHSYTPDFILPNGIIVEAKGIFSSADRAKHLLIKEQHPELDIRFVFGYANNKLTKKSKTTYWMWCEKNGFRWASELIPKEWIEEEK